MLPEERRQGGRNKGKEERRSSKHGGAASKTISTRTKTWGTLKKKKKDSVYGALSWCMHLFNYDIFLNNLYVN